MTHKDIFYTLMISSIVSAIGIFIIAKYIHSDLEITCQYVPLDQIENTKCKETN